MSICTDHHHCQETAIATAESLCQSRGIRLTPQRRQVLTLIWQSHRPVKAYDLLDQLRLSDASAKPPTVYRALDFLMEHGLIHRIDSLNAYTGCGHPDDHPCDCYFMICQSCGIAEECCNPDLAKTIHQMAAGRGFTPQQTVLEIAGFCQDCA